MDQWRVAAGIEVDIGKRRRDQGVEDQALR
jgi:hypothetical protein